ncbi:MAG: DUF3276 family protein [Spirochaetaceae bacterium]|nr:DUF3276 family protein [Spirochaetaceae bacterium]
MGIRGELFSTKFMCDGRTYFFNVKQNRTGDVFLSIVESKPSEGESFDRRSIVVFGEHMEGFLKSFQSALKFMDKTGNKVPADASLYDRGDNDDGYDRRTASSERGGFQRGDSYPRSSERSFERSSDKPPKPYRKYGDSSSSDHRAPARDRPAYSSDHRPPAGGRPDYSSDRRRQAKPAVRFSSAEKRPASRQADRAEGKPARKIIVRKAKKSED